jgi:hypothetical protein
MSLSAKHRNQDSVSHANRPSSHDLIEMAPTRSSTAEPATGREYDSLVEHILDFLDRYPARLTSRTPLTGCMRAC